MTTKEVSAKLKMADKTIRKWALENGVSFTGEGRRKDYQWTEDDIIRFMNRNQTKGRPKTKK